MVAPEEIRTEYGIDKNFDKNMAALNKKAVAGGQNSRTQSIIGEPQGNKRSKLNRVPDNLPDK